MIIFLNGSINSGKSTIAKLLVKAMPNAAIVEIDALREMINWMPIHAPSFGTVINNTKQTPEETTEEILKNI